MIIKTWSETVRIDLRHFVHNSQFCSVSLKFRKQSGKCNTERNNLRSLARIR